MTGTTISSYTTTSLVLTQPSQNPVTITASGTINTLGAYAVYGAASTAWKITNNGQLSGALYGVELTGGGTVINGSNSNTTARVSFPGGYQYTTYGHGISITGGAGTVANYGTITPSANPTYQIADVILADGGQVTNGSNGDASAYIWGDVMLGGAGSATNFGRIGSVSLETGGSVTNGSSTDTSAIIGHLGFTPAAVFISGGEGQVVNYGGIGESYLGYDGWYGTGVVMTAGGTYHQRQYY